MWFSASGIAPDRNDLAHEAPLHQVHLTFVQEKVACTIAAVTCDQAQHNGLVLGGNFVLNMFLCCTCFSPGSGNTMMPGRSMSVRSCSSGPYTFRLSGVSTSVLAPTPATSSVARSTASACQRS